MAFELDDFAGINAEQIQKDNIGGVTRIAVVLDKRFTRVWPVKTDAPDGEVTTAPPLVPGVKIAVWDVPQGTAEVGSNLQGPKGGQSYRHNVEFAFAGQDKESIKEQRKLINASVVVFFMDGNGQWKVAGQGLKGIGLESTGTTGKTGGDLNGSTFTGERVGYPYPALPLAASVVEELEFDMVEYELPTPPPQQQES